jgi:hypothetical protein
MKIRYGVALGAIGAERVSDPLGCPAWPDACLRDAGQVVNVKRIACGAYKFVGFDFLVH